jgi:DNA sulfur modification protein DndC
MSKVELVLRRRPFDGAGAEETVNELVEEIQELYLSDEVPWVVGYSGGKDSTAVLQLVWNALEALEPEQRTKPVYVISTDTLVENPVVATWVGASLETMREFATQKQMPVLPNRLTPEIKDTFWVNLIGRGYPAPRHKFRWCTERLKIKPSNKFIKEKVAEHGEVILVLGIRKAESSARSRAMQRAEKGRTRDRLSPNTSLPNSMVYSPIEEWTNDEVWMYLMDYPNPWGYDNKDLLTMYQGASPDGECPLVVDSTTPSCGSSRFGCWTCTLVEKDKSMSAMIQNDEEKEWMLPLLELRDELDLADDRHLRDFRRMNGSITVFHDRSVHGPYLQSVREMWLTKLLEAQRWIRENGPEYVNKVELITLPELEEIRRIWVFEKHEIEDNLPKIYETTTGLPFPALDFDDVIEAHESDIEALSKICGGDIMLFQMTRDLIAIERQYRTMAKRSGVFEAMEKAISKSFYEDEEDALTLARIETRARNLRSGKERFDSNNETGVSNSEN